MKPSNSFGATNSFSFGNSFNSNSTSTIQAPRDLAPQPAYNWHIHQYKVPGQTPNNVMVHRATAASLIPDNDGHNTARKNAVVNHGKTDPVYGNTGTLGTPNHPDHYSNLWK